MVNDITPSLEEHKLFCITEIHTYGDNLRSIVLSGTTEAERAAWPTKGRIASNILKGNAHPAEIATVQVEVDARDRGETVEQLATVQFTKSLALMTVDNQISGLTDKAISSIASCVTSEQIDQTFAAVQVEHTKAKDAVLLQLKG